MALDGEECIEERVNEQEALESIFVHEYSVAEDGDQGTEEDGWVGRTFDVRITPTGTEEVDESEADAYSLGLVLRFTYTEAYPNEGLPIEFRGVAGLDEEEEAALQEKIDEVVEDMSGAGAMVFAICQEAKDFLDDYTEQAAARAAARRKAEREAAAEAHRLENEARRGTPVTREAFAEWKAAFKAEMAAAKEAEEAAAGGSRGGRRRKANEGRQMTGREIFLNDSSMVESDASQGGGEEDLDFDVNAVKAERDRELAMQPVDDGLGLGLTANANPVTSTSTAGGSGVEVDADLFAGEDLGDLPSDSDSDSSSGSA